jgi:branched-chain amino acid transport system ATP-binding protein
MLAFGRALVINPRLLLLDEPLEGLAPIIVEELLRAIRRVGREEGLSSIVVEQHPHMVLGVTDDAIVLDRGGIAYRASSEALLDDPAPLDAWLGVAAAH